MSGRGSWCYVAIQPCGCITGAAVDLVASPKFGGDTKDNRQFVADSISEFAKSGCRVERKWVGEGGVSLQAGWPQSCPHQPQQPQIVASGEEA